MKTRHTNVEKELKKAMKSIVPAHAMPGVRAIVTDFGLSRTPKSV